MKGFIEMLSKIERAPVILIEGPDFSGKSSFINFFYNKCKNTTILREPDGYLRPTIIDNNKIDDMFMSHNSMYLRERGRYSLLASARISTYINICNLIKEKNMVILDRSFPSSMVYQRILEKDIFGESLDMIRDITIEILEESICLPDLILFLEISPKTYLSRLEKRGKTNSMDEMSVNGVNSLLSSYRDIMIELMYSYEYNKKVLNIDANSNHFEHTSSLIEDFLSNFKLGNGSSWLKDKIE